MMTRQPNHLAELDQAHANARAELLDTVAAASTLVERHGTAVTAGHLTHILTNHDHDYLVSLAALAIAELATHHHER